MGVVFACVSAVCGTFCEKTVHQPKAVAVAGEVSAAGEVSVAVVVVAAAVATVVAAATVAATASHVARRGSQRAGRQAPAADGAGRYALVAVCLCLEWWAVRGWQGGWVGRVGGRAGGREPYSAPVQPTRSPAGRRALLGGCLGADVRMAAAGVCSPLSLALLAGMRCGAGPRDAEWPARHREELVTLIAAVTANRAADREWYTLTCDDTVRGGVAG